MRRISTLLIGFYLIFSNASAQEIDTAYNYPIKPGTEEWKKYTTGDEMTLACNIPDSILNRLSTKALASTCMNYPLFHEIFYSNSLQDGIEGLSKRFNGIAELLKRTDAGKELFLIYKNSNPNDLDKNLDLNAKLYFH